MLKLWSQTSPPFCLSSSWFREFFLIAFNCLGKKPYDLRSRFPLRLHLQLLQVDIFSKYSAAKLTWQTLLILANFYLLGSRGNIILINIQLWIKHTKHFVTKWFVQQHDSGKKPKESLLLWLKPFLVFTKRKCVKCAIVADTVVLSWIVITSWIVIAVVNLNNSCREMYYLSFVITYLLQIVTTYYRNLW